MSRRVWIGAALAVAAPWLAATAASPVRERPIAFLALFGASGIAWLACAWRVSGPASRLPPLWLVVAAGLAMRAAALPAEPGDDVWRVLWEADVLRAGHDPYVLAPGSPELDALRARGAPGGPVNHPGWTAIYLPAAQAWGLLFAHGVLTLKLSLVLAELAALWLLVRTLEATGRPASRALVYWWAPLPVYAFAMEAHIDALAVALLTAALAGWATGRDAAGGAALALSVLVKPFGAAIAPAWLRTVRPAAWLAFAAAAAAILAPFASSGLAMFGSLVRFGAEMRTGDTLHALIAAVLGAAGATHPLASRATAAAAWLLLATGVAIRGRPRGIEGSALLLGALLLLLPTMHPWYLAPMLPLLCFVPWRGWLVVSVTIALPLAAHLEMRGSGEWVEWRALTWLAHAPLYAWLLSCVGRRIGGFPLRNRRGAGWPARRSGSGA